MTPIGSDRLSIENNWKTNQMSAFRKKSRGSVANLFSSVSKRVSVSNRKANFLETLSNEILIPRKRSPPIGRWTTRAVWIPYNVSLLTDSRQVARQRARESLPLVGDA